MDSLFSSHPPAPRVWGRYLISHRGCEMLVFFLFSRQGVGDFWTTPLSCAFWSPLCLQRLQDNSIGSLVKNMCLSHYSCTLKMLTIALPHVCGFFTTCCGGSQNCGSEIAEALHQTSSSACESTLCFLCELWLPMLPSKCTHCISC